MSRRPAPRRTADELAAARAQVVALASELDRTRRALWIERALRRYPGAEAAVELITATDEVAILGQAEKLARLVGA